MFFCCHLRWLNVGTGQHEADRGGILFYVGSYAQNINVWMELSMLTLIFIKKSIRFFCDLSEA
jgi:hypothetical protein